MTTLDELIDNVESAFHEKIEAKGRLYHAEIGELTAKITALEFLYPSTPKEGLRIMAGSLSSDKVIKLLNVSTNRKS